MNAEQKGEKWSTMNDGAKKKNVSKESEIDERGFYAYANIYRENVKPL